MTSGPTLTPAPSDHDDADRGAPADLEPPVTASTELIPPPERPPLARRGEGAWLGGVANGVAQHLGWSPLLVRGAFVALSAVQFLGVFLYGLLWVLLPEEKSQAAPGIESASRRGLRQKKAHGWPGLVRDAGPVTALAAFGVGAVWLSSSLGLGMSSRWFWPFAFAAAGVALVWRQADEAPTEQDAATWLRPFVATGGWLGVTRMVVGLGLVGLSVSLVTASKIGVNELPTVIGMALLMLTGLFIAAAPWIHRARRALTKQREEQLVLDARADMAAHLHDSVLQTLALIQRQSEDPKAVATLARRQERELRTWLYGDGPEHDTTLKPALTTAAAEVEDEFGVPVEVVVVGDTPVDDSLRALVQAAREAMVNAAKHSRAEAIDVFGEVEEGTVEVFVRDRGVGFDLDDVGTDRMGVRRSIIDRMERHGGNAVIRSTPGEGTEIKLSMTTR